MSTISIVFCSLWALLFSVGMAAAHKDFQESMLQNMVSWLMLIVLPWFSAVGSWLLKMKASKPSADVNSDSKVYYWLGLISSALFFAIAITFSTLMCIPRILKSDTLF